MGRGWRLLTGLLAATLCEAWVAAAVDQNLPPTTTPVDWELAPEVRAALERMEDFTFNVDQPGFYSVLAAVKRNPRSPGFRQAPLEVQDWRDLLERPADFRGRVVTVEGVVGRNKDPYVLHKQPELGQFWQLELRRADQPVACTLVLTQDATDIPLGASVRATGYFVMIRQYYTSTNRVGQAPVIVAPGPTSVSRAGVGTTATGGPDWRWMVGAVIAGVAITALLLWRASATRRQDPHTLRASHEAPLSLADDLQAWAHDEGPEDEPPGDEYADR